MFLSSNVMAYMTPIKRGQLIENPGSDDIVLVFVREDVEIRFLMFHPYKKTDIESFIKTFSKMTKCKLVERGTAEQHNYSIKCARLLNVEL